MLMMSKRGTSLMKMNSIKDTSPKISTPPIIYEDNHLIAVNKSGSDLVQGDRTGDETLPELLKSWLKIKYKKTGNVYLGVIHRLDRPVSGVVIYAKTSKALTRMNRLFRTGSVKKTYWAIVASKPPFEADTLTHYLKKNKIKNKSYVTGKFEEGSKEAVLSYKLMYTFRKYYLLEIDLKTGRHHQIRCQLSQIGCPVLGDLKYGYPRSLEQGGIALHAREISFSHPVSNEFIRITADPGKHKLWETYLEKISHRKSGTNQ